MPNQPNIPLLFKRVSSQLPEDLYQFYRQISDPGPNYSSNECGEQMLKLLPRLEDIAAELPVWGFTSLDRLVLLAADDCHSPWFVIVRAVAWGGYVVRYHLPEDAAPWPNAYVEGETEDGDIETAFEMIRLAMHHSGGWPQMEQQQQDIAAA